MISSKELNIIRGKVLGGNLNSVKREELLAVFDCLDQMEELLDEADQQDALGTEGWRHAAGLDG